jgi:HPt (histidine-containing phosphotransfer) domain-containing protein
VEDLLGRCLGNLQFAERVLTMFQQRCDEDLAELERAVATEDTEAVVSLAHRLKGASANAAALGLRARASQMEQAARRRSLAETRQHLEDLRDEWHRFRSAISLLGTLPESIA